MSLRARDTTAGVEFAVKVVPGSSQDRIAGLYGDALKVQVAAAPEGGKANQRLAEVLAAALQVPTRWVAVVHGLQQPRKTVRVQGLTLALLQQRLRLA